MEFLKGKIAEIINHAFQTLLVTYLVLLLAEQVQTGFVSNYLNLDYLLIAVILLGVASVFSEQKKPKKQKATVKDYAFIAILAVAGFIIIKVKTGDLGWLSWLISTVAGILIALLSILVLDEEEEEEEKPFELTKKNAPKVIGISLAALLALAIGLSFLNLSFVESARIVFGSVFVLFLPGFALSYAFFPQNAKKEGIDWLERVALSFALSIAVVPLLVFYFNLIGLKINAWTVSLVTMLVILAAVFIAWRRARVV